MILDARPVAAALVVALACGGSPASPEGGAPECPTTVSAPTLPANVLIRETFADACLASRGWFDNTNVVVTTSERAPNSTSAAQFRFLRGATTPTSGGAIRHLFTPSSSMYVGYYVKYSSNWVGSQKPYHPHEFLAMSTMDGEYDGPSVSWLAVYVEHNFDGGGRPRLAIQDSKAINGLLGTLPLNLVNVTEERSTSGCNGVVEAGFVTECYNAPPWVNNKQLRGPVTLQPGPGPGYKGSWNFIEAYFQLNTVTGGAARADGVMQYWFNGTLIIDRHDVLFRTAPRADLQFRQFLIAPYIGDGSPVEQSMYVADLTVATSRAAAR